MQVDDHLAAAAYALGALEETERREFEAHARGCAACRAEAAGLTETVALLAAADAVPAGDELLDRVLGEVRTTPRLPPVPHRPPSPGRAARRPPPAPARRWLAAAAATLALALLTGAVIAGLRLSRDPETDPRTELADLAADPRTRQITLRGEGPGEVVVLLQPDTGRAGVDARALPAPGTARTYELWFLEGGSARRAVTFDPDGEGRAGAVFQAPLASPDAFGVTVEPAGGSDTPTPPIILTAEA